MSNYRLLANTERLFNPIELSLSSGCITLYVHHLLKNLKQSRNILGFNVNFFLGVINALIGIATIVLTGSRMPFIALSLVLIFQNISINIRVFLRIIAIVLIVVALFWSNIGLEFEGNISNFTDRFLRLQGLFDGDYDRSSLARLEKLTSVKDKLFVFFFGQKNYEPYPHNIFLEILLRWGTLFGLPLLIIINRTLYKVLVRRRGVFNNGDVLSALFIFSFLFSLTSLSLEMNRFLFLGMGYILFNKSNESFTQS